MLQLSVILSVPAGRFPSSCAEVAELADALASGASGRKPIGVQIPASAPFDSLASIQLARSWQATCPRESNGAS